MLARRIAPVLAPFAARSAIVCAVVFAVMIAVVFVNRGTAGGRPAASPQGRTVVVQLLAINDLHGNLEPPAGAEGMVNRVLAGGAEYLATHLRKAASDNPNSIVVAAGDLMGASPLLSGLFHDEPTIEAMNAMHLDVTSIGNHELDHGPAELLRRIAGGCPEAGGCADDEKDNEKPGGAHFRCRRERGEDPGPGWDAAAGDGGAHGRRRADRVHRRNA